MVKKPILYLDMDNVLADFGNSYMLSNESRETNCPPEMYKKGFFYLLDPVPGAIRAANRLIDSGKYDVHILTQPVIDSHYSYSEKVRWVQDHLPALVGKITMTQNKLLINGDYLIDDNIKWEKFDGAFILFDYKNAERSWNNILEVLL